MPKFVTYCNIRNALLNWRDSEVGSLMDIRQRKVI